MKLIQSPSLSYTGDYEARDIYKGDNEAHLFFHIPEKLVHTYKGDNEAHPVSCIQQETMKLIQRALDFIHEQNLRIASGAPAPQLPGVCVCVCVCVCVFVYVCLYPRCHPPTHATHPTHPTHPTHAAHQRTLLTRLTLLTLSPYINLLNLQRIYTHIYIHIYTWI